MGPLPSATLLRDIVLDSTRKLPLHVQLKTSLQRLIHENFDDTSRFFSESQLTGQLQVSQGTVRRALTELAADGIIEKRPARGTIVRKKSTARKLEQIAVFLPEYFSSNLTAMISRLNGEALRRQINLQAIFTHKDEFLRRAYNQLQFQPEEGSVVLLANSPMATAELTAVLEDKGYNCVTVDTLLNDPRQKYVGVDNRAGIEIGLNHLVALGHRSIALLVNEPAASQNVQERIDAFQSYHRNNGLQLDTQVYVTGTRIWENSSAKAFFAMEEIWNADPRPTAIFGVSDSGAISAIQWLQKRKVRVPEEVSVLGFDGSEFGALIHPMLCTVASPFDALAGAVFGILDNKPSSTNRVFIAPTLLQRESTGARPQPDSGT